MRAPARTPREPSMENRWSCRSPSKISRRKFRIEKAMQKTRIGHLQSFILDLDAAQKALVAAKAEMARDGRLCAICTHNMARRDIDP